SSHRFRRQEHGAIPAGIVVRGEPPARPGSCSLSADAKGQSGQSGGAACYAEAAVTQAAVNGGALRFSPTPESGAFAALTVFRTVSTSKGSPTCPPLSTTRLMRA